MKRKFNKTIMYFSLIEREKRKYALYAKQRTMYEQLSGIELSERYIDAKSRYEAKKYSFIIFVGVILLTILTQFWITFFKFTNRMLHIISLGQPEPENIAKVGLILFSILMFFVIFISFITVSNYLRSLYHLYRRLLLIEEVRKNKDGEGLKEIIK